MRPTSIGAEIAPLGSDAWNIVAAGTGDNTEVIGQTINRQGFQSGALQIPFKAVLAGAQTLSVLVKRQQSADGSAWDTAETVVENAVVATGAGTVRGVVELDQDLTALKQYVRYNVTPDLSAGATDTAVLGLVFVAGGAHGNKSIPA